MGSQISSGGKKKWILGGGVVVALALVGIVVLDYPPASDDAAGTIVPAKRFRADGAGTAAMADQSNVTASGDASAQAANSANSQLGELG